MDKNQFLTEISSFITNKCRDRAKGDFNEYYSLHLMIAAGMLATILNEQGPKVVEQSFEFLRETYPMIKVHRVKAKPEVKYEI